MQIQLTRCSEEYGHLERLALDDVSTRARTRRGEAARDGVNTVQGSRKNEIFVRGQAW